MPFYELDVFQCPIAWPEQPHYPIDIEVTSPVASTSHTPLTEEVPEVSIDWLRAVYLEALYGLDKLKDASDLQRVASFAQSLRCWLPPISEDILVRALEPLADCDHKWRKRVPAALADPAASDLPEDEQLALQAAFHVYRGQQETLEHDRKGKTRWKAVTQREWTNGLEFLEHRLQIVLLLEILSNVGLEREVPDANAPDHEAHLDLLSDRLAIHQALHGIGDLLGDSLRGGVELDDVQQFWRDVVETNYGSAFPRQALEEHRGKIFPEMRSPTPFSDDEPALAAKGARASTLVPSSPFSHPTPNLMRLARSVQDAQAAAEEAKFSVPASPTLAKLLGVAPSRDKEEQQRRQFNRSKSSGALAMAARQVSMGRSMSVESESQVGAQRKAPLFGGMGKARTSKRKQASPKKSSGKTLVVATPNRKLARANSMPDFHKADSQALSFAALGKAFRPGSQTFGSFDPISEEHQSLPVVLVGETPQKPRYMEAMMEEGLGATPG